MISDLIIKCKSCCSQYSFSANEISPTCVWSDCSFVLCGHVVCILGQKILTWGHQKIVQCRHCQVNSCHCKWVLSTSSSTIAHCKHACSVCNISHCCTNSIMKCTRILCTYNMAIYIYHVSAMMCIISSKQPMVFIAVFADLLLLLFSSV